MFHIFTLIYFTYFYILLDDLESKFSSLKIASSLKLNLWGTYGGLTLEMAAPNPA